MKIFPIIILLILFNCRSPHLITQDTYLHAHEISKTYAFHNLVQKPTDITLKGVFSQPIIHEVPLNSFIYLKGNTLHQISLSDSIDVFWGDYVRITGQISDTVIYHHNIAQQVMPLFRIKKYQLLSRTSNFFPQAQKDYQTYRDEIEQQVKPPESRLDWPKKPLWKLCLIDTTSQVILSFSEADLMYALHVDLVYKLQNNSLVEIYAQEIFKGE